MADIGGNLLEVCYEAGWMSWAVLLLAAIGAFAGTERVITLGRIRWSAAACRRRLDRILDEGSPQELAAPCRLPLDRVLAAAVPHLDGGPEQVSAALELQTRREARKLYRRLDLLGMVVVTAPMCGFLGTVYGIAGAWSYSGLSGPGWVYASISEALLATALGLGVAIPTQLVLVHLRSWAERSEAEIEDATRRLLAHLGSPAETRR